MSEDSKKNEFSLVKSVCWKESASVAALLLQMSEQRVIIRGDLLYSVVAVVDLYLALEGCCRRCHSNEIMEELSHKVVQHHA